MRLYLFNQWGIFRYYKELDAIRMLHPLVPARGPHRASATDLISGPLFVLHSQSRVHMVCASARPSGHVRAVGEFAPRPAGHRTAGANCVPGSRQSTSLYSRSGVTGGSGDWITGDGGRLD